VKLTACDVVRADVRVLPAKDLFSTQSALTGEALPTEKPAPAGTRGLSVQLRVLMCLHEEDGIFLETGQVPGFKGNRHE
jgi:magnesium-transporting ATPase (P-type)